MAPSGWLTRVLQTLYAWRCLSHIFPSIELFQLPDTTFAYLPLQGLQGLAAQIMPKQEPKPRTQPKGLAGKKKKVCLSCRPEESCG